MNESYRHLTDDELQRFAERERDQLSPESRGELEAELERRGLAPQRPALPMGAGGTSLGAVTVRVVEHKLVELLLQILLFPFFMVGMLAGGLFGTGVLWGGLATTAFGVGGMALIRLAHRKKWFQRDMYVIAPVIAFVAGGLLLPE